MQPFDLGIEQREMENTFLQHAYDYVKRITPRKSVLHLVMDIASLFLTVTVMHQMKSRSKLVHFLSFFLSFFLSR